MQISFQQPGSSGLIATLNSAAEHSTSCGGVFAFASKAGFESYLNCPNIKHMLENNRDIYIIIGVDAVTNSEALLYIEERIVEFPNSLKVNVFYHENINSIFHPKFAWFKYANGMKLIIGSCNLTTRGLGQYDISRSPFGNWEVFGLHEYTDTQAIQLEEIINDWIINQEQNGFLLPINNEKVRNRAMFNSRVRLPRLPRQLQTITHEEIISEEYDEEKTEVLIREIPKNRPGQADIGRKALKEFFGYEEDGDERNIFLQHVSLDNELEAVREVRLFVNKSRNYRLELHAMSDISYEIGTDDSRMLLVAIKFDDYSYRYTVIPVNNSNYQIINNHLPRISSSQGRKMREIMTTSDKLSEIWPNVPSHLLPITSIMPEL
jgi:hypothetical protein